MIERSHTVEQKQWTAHIICLQAIWSGLNPSCSVLRYVHLCKSNLANMGQAAVTASTVFAERRLWLHDSMQTAPRTKILLKIWLSLVQRFHRTFQTGSFQNVGGLEPQFHWKSTHHFPLAGFGPLPQTEYVDAQTLCNNFPLLLTPGNLFIDIFIYMIIKYI